MIWSTTSVRGITFPQLEALQRDTRDGLRQFPNTGVFLVSEPQPTYTAGRAADPRGLIWSEQTARARGYEIFHVSRGGQWTFHGPGQIVVYPLAMLRSLGYPSKGVRRFLGDLRAGVVDFLIAVGVTPDQPDPSRPFGVYSAGAKLASFGMAVERGISAHGLALYLQDQTSAFQGIHPCGVREERLGSLEGCGVHMDWNDAAALLVSHLKNRFPPSKTC